MRKLNFFLISSSLLFALSACTEKTIIKDPTPAPKPAEMPTPMVGGYSAVDPNEQEIFEINKFMEAELKAGGKNLWTEKIIRAEKQVVAGTNYRLLLLMSDSNQYQAVIYRDLQGAAEISSFQRI